MKKTARFLFTAALLALAWSASADNPDRIIGRYLSHDRDGEFIVYYDGELYQGVIVYSRSYGGSNCRRVIILRDLRYDAEKDEWNGKIYDMRFDRQYNLRVRLLPSGDMRITPWWGPLKMNFTWTRIPEET